MTADAGGSRPAPPPVGPAWAVAATTAAAMAATAVVAGSFLPWVRTGAAERSSYDLVTSARRLEVLDGVAADLAPVWFLLPALCGGAWLAVGLRWRRAGAILAGVVGLLGVGFAQQTAVSSLDHLPGVTVTGGAGLITIVAALVGGLPRRSPRVGPSPVR